MIKKEHALGALFLTFLLLSVAAYMKEESYKETKLVEQIVQKGELSHSAYLTNDTVYGRIASLEYYPTRILDTIYANYTYSIDPSEAGSYYITGMSSYYVTKGKTKIYLLNETIFTVKGRFSNGTFTQGFKVNLTEIRNRKSELAKALELPRISTEVKIIARIRTKEGEFKQEMPIIEDTSGLTYIGETELEKKKNIVNTETIQNSFLGMKVSTSRIVFPLLALASAVALLIVWKPKPKRRINAIDGTPTGITSRVFIANEGSLKKIAKIIGSPIIHYTIDGVDIYGVIDGNVIYEWWAMKTDGPESKQ
ncbi:hypothetical protein CHITON_1339 [Thermococcus chitonophagus]|uniref:DUF5305 domain-containing protein n=1 Tax=Thermococcus chitonophagus TaxID=54262 RepID=A0A161K9I6_9EURY|nr:hypothetical protein CHITON_1339 [Thermococcus chitonophagus]